MRPDLLWLTNISTPYTAPVWREIAQRCTLKVACMAATEHNRNWQVDTEGISVSILRCRSLKLGYETRLYLPNTRLLALLFVRPRTLVVDGWESPAGLTALLLGKILRITTVISYWSTTDSHRYTRGPVAWIRWGAFRLADKVYTPGTAARRAAMQAGAAEENIVTGFPAVDSSIFYRDDATRAAAPHDAQGHRYIFAGQLITRKNVSSLLDAFARVASPHDKLLIAGEGPQKRAVEQQIARLRLSPRVEMLGHLEPLHLRGACDRSDTLVLPSESEVWGLVVNEALHCGLSVIVSQKCGAAQDMYEWPGVIVSGTSAEDLASALLQAQTTPSPSGAHPIEEQTPSALAELLVNSLVRPNLYQ